MRVRLPRRHPAAARPHQHQVQGHHRGDRGRAPHHPGAVRAGQDSAARHPHGLLPLRLAAQRRRRRRLQGLRQRVPLVPARRRLRLQQLPPRRVRLLQEPVGEEAAQVQRDRQQGVRGGHPGVRARRRGHHPAHPLEQHPAGGLPAHRQRVLPQLPQVHAGRHGLRAARAHRRCLRGAPLLHGADVHGRQVHVRRRVPRHAGLPRPLRRQPPRPQDTAQEGGRRGGEGAG